jgi:hypothetical protein
MGFRWYDCDCYVTSPLRPYSSDDTSLRCQLSKWGRGTTTYHNGHAKFETMLVPLLWLVVLGVIISDVCSVPASSGYCFGRVRMERGGIGLLGWPVSARFSQRRISCVTCDTSLCADGIRLKRRLGMIRVSIGKVKLPSGFRLHPTRRHCRVPINLTSLDSSFRLTFVSYKQRLGY